MKAMQNKALVGLVEPAVSLEEIKLLDGIKVSQGQWAAGSPVSSCDEGL